MIGGMDILEETKALAEKAGVTREDIQSLGLSWRWYLKVRAGHIPNPGVIHVVALRDLAQRKLGKRRKAAA
jgi:hypothetical protein